MSKRNRDPAKEVIIRIGSKTRHNGGGAERGPYSNEEKGQGERRSSGEQEVRRCMKKKGEKKR